MIQLFLLVFKAELSSLTSNSEKEPTFIENDSTGESPSHSVVSAESGVAVSSSDSTIMLETNHSEDSPSTTSEKYSIFSHHIFLRN